MKDPRSVKALEKRIVHDYSQLAETADVFRRLGWKIVITIGTYDMIHVGHARYLDRASELGDLLIVGVDSDQAVKIYKREKIALGEFRPIVPEAERLEMLLHLQAVSLVTLINDVDEDGNWQYGLLDTIRPDVFVAVSDSYPPEQLAEIEKRCGEVIILDRQAETSTTETIRQMVMNPNRVIAAELRKMADALESEEPA